MHTTALDLPLGERPAFRLATCGGVGLQATKDARAARARGRGRGRGRGIGWALPNQTTTLLGKGGIKTRRPLQRRETYGAFDVEAPRGFRSRTVADDRSPALPDASFARARVYFQGLVTVVLVWLLLLAAGIAATQ